MQEVELVRRVVVLKGSSFALDVSQRALELHSLARGNLKEPWGGNLTHTLEETPRTRTPGGIFAVLLKGDLSLRERALVFKESGGGRLDLLKKVANEEDIPVNYRPMYTKTSSKRVKSKVSRRVENSQKIPHPKRARQNTSENDSPNSSHWLGAQPFMTSPKLFNHEATEPDTIVPKVAVELSMSERGRDVLNKVHEEKGLE